jgi:hypothetical protein
VVTSAASCHYDLPDSRLRIASASDLKLVATDKEQQSPSFEDTSKYEYPCLLGYNAVLSGAFMVLSSCWFLLGLLFDPEAGGDVFLRNGC